KYCAKRGDHLYQRHLEPKRVLLLLRRQSRRPKPFQVTSADRNVKKGIMANGLRDPLNKLFRSLQRCSSLGSGWDTQGHSETCPEATPVLSWVMRNELKPQPRKDVAKITFDLYKNNPQDFFGCLNVKATLYGIYSVSYDMRCYDAKKMLKEALRWTLFSMQATGHVLLGSSWTRMTGQTGACHHCHRKARSNNYRAF
uniref:Cell death inducing DFFA like effector c n=1 Tax=Salmo trutta TaxID=8032 RepID=A0A674B821_SALTR